MKINDYFGKNNNFNLLRFIAASTVLYQHSYPLFNHSPHGSYLANIVNAVAVFFIISGFLITKSWCDKPEIFFYLKNRFLRIVPGLFVCLLFTILIIGPVCTKLSLAEYFSQKGTYRYLLKNITFNVRYSLPGVFEENPYKDAVNGSLWTLPVEVFCYLGVMVFSFRRFFTIKYLLSIVTIFVISYYLYVVNNPDSLLLYSVPQFLKWQSSLLCVCNFLVGANFFLYADKIKLKKSFALIALGCYLYPTSNAEFAIFSQFIALPYLIFYLAFCVDFQPSFLKNFGKKYDLSYGIYIYAFPVQQAVMHFLSSHINLSVFFVLSYFITAILAFLSFTIIEKPCLRFKTNKIWGIKFNE